MVAALDGIRGYGLRADRNRRDALRRGRNARAVSRAYWAKTAGAWLPSWLSALDKISKNRVGRTGFEPVTSSVPGKVIRRACFRILLLSCDVWSADVHECMLLSRAVVTRLVTHADLKPSAEFLSSASWRIHVRTDRILSCPAWHVDLTAAIPSPCLAAFPGRPCGDAQGDDRIDGPSGGPGDDDG
jgi:hypothetical protein